MTDKAAEQSRAGYNSCPGSHVVRIELPKISCIITRNYTTRLIGPIQKKWKWEAYFRVRPRG